MLARTAAEELTDLGYAIGWRLERTDAEAGPVSEVVDAPPSGTITNVAVSGSELIIFVSPPDDLLQEFAADALACPTP